MEPRLQLPPSSTYRDVQAPHTAVACRLGDGLVWTARPNILHLVFTKQGDKSHRPQVAAEQPPAAPLLRREREREIRAVPPPLGLHGQALAGLQPQLVPRTRVCIISFVLVNLTDSLLL